jgi:hypothetical protein
MNNDGLNSKNIVDCVNTFNDISLLIVIQGNNHEMNSDGLNSKNIVNCVTLSMTCLY